MELVLQNKESLTFVEDQHGRWTKDRQRARTFGSGLEALFFCLSHRLMNMQIVGRFLDSRMDFSLPVTDLRGD